MAFLTRLAKDLDAVAKPASGYLVFAKRGAATTPAGKTLPVFEITPPDISRGGWKLKGRTKYGRATAHWGDRKTARIHDVTVGSSGPTLTLNKRYNSAAEARSAAQAAINKSGRASGTINLDMSGFRPNLFAEATANIQGIKPELTGQWLITRVEHRLSGSLTTNIEAERDNDKD